MIIYKSLNRFFSLPMNADKNSDFYYRFKCAFSGVYLQRSPKSAGRRTCRVDRHSWAANNKKGDSRAEAVWTPGSRSLMGNIGVHRRSSAARKAREQTQTGFDRCMDLSAFICVYLRLEKLA
jgi:hypothetical protein